MNEMPIERWDTPIPIDLLEIAADSFDALNFWLKTIKISNATIDNTAHRMTGNV